MRPLRLATGPAFIRVVYPIECWSMGHMTVAYIAYRNLTLRTRTRDALRN
ncbi:MAG: hypothetical protein U0Q18_24935 [Bryobacteraceae bacterium]